MDPKDCCKSSIRAISQGEDVGFFVEQGRRNPIGKELTFYECSACERQWVREELTAEPYTETWSPS